MPTKRAAAKRPTKKPAATVASATGRCPDCGALTTTEGKGQRACRTCGWKGKV